MTFLLLEFILCYPVRSVDNLYSLKISRREAFEYKFKFRKVETRFSGSFQVPSADIKLIPVV